MNNFLSRSITGIAYVALILSALLFNRYIYFSVFLLLLIFSQAEFYSLIKNRVSGIKIIPGITIGCFMFLSTFLYRAGFLMQSVLFVNILLVFVLFVVELLDFKNFSPEKSAINILGIVYIALPFSLLNYLAFYHIMYFKGIFILAMFVLLWVSDTMAYVTGMLVGKHKLAPSISPKKTWEGYIGGLLFTLLGAYLISLYSPLGDLYFWLGFGLVVNVFGLFGDFFESGIKRFYGVKDSGNILPGHGGILDRLDSMLFAIPASYIYIIIYFHSS